MANMKWATCKRRHRLNGNRLKDGRCAKCRREYMRVYMRARRRRQGRA